MERFFLDKDPRRAAEKCEEGKVEEYIKECASILCTTLHETRSKIDEYVKPAKKGNPEAVKWVSDSFSHWRWMWIYGHYLGNKYSKMTKEIHSDTRTLRCLPVPSNIRKNGWRDPVTKAEAI